jgi:FkbM family methyltransferase
MKSKFRIESIVNKRANFEINSPAIVHERKYLLFPNDNSVTKSLYDNDIYEPWLYQFLFDNNIDINSSTVIDIGANNGQISVEFAHLVGDTGKVYSFEPQRLIFYQLCANVFYNGLDNVYTNNVALGNNTGKISIEKPDYFSNESVNFGDVHVGVSENYDLVEVRNLDSYNF